MIGTKLAHFTITAHLGSGGMGDVYQATDSKLGRSVAIKLLPEAFVHDAERAARFEREARVLASLNHPNIGAIYGIEQSGERKFLVMELVPGETLAERIKRGPIPVSEALNIAKQIAEALEAAHDSEKAVIHRDLKLANVKVTPDGKVKVLDFGLAKAFEAEGSNANLSQSPTLSMGATNPGMILGTAAYMSPEQAKGMSVDRRSDIFSFGALLYEMLTGRQAFPGDTVGDILAAVIRAEPDWTRLPADVSPAVRKLLRLCLEKDVKKRRRDAGDLRIDIEQALAEPEPPVAAAAPRAMAFPAAALTVAVLLTAAFSSAFWWFRGRSTQTTPVPMHLSVKLDVRPAGQIFSGADAVISPDGTRLVYRVNQPGNHLYLQDIRAGSGRFIAGTEDVIGGPPFFSPDGLWFAFATPTALKKVSISGGSPVSICELSTGTTQSFFGGAWGPDNRIVFVAGFNDGIWSVSADGGRPELLLKTDEGKDRIAYTVPQVLPDGKGVLFTLSSGHAITTDDTQIAVLEPGATEPRVLLRDVTKSQYVPTGHLVYSHRGALLAVPFDLSRLAITGPPATVIEGIESTLVLDSVFSISNSGTLAYAPRGTDIGGTRLAIADRKGTIRPLTDGRALPWDFSVSPNGKQIAAEVLAVNNDIWVYDVANATPLRMTFEPGDEIFPQWTPDGRRIAFGTKVGRIFWRAADGAGQREELLRRENYSFPSSFSPDGKTMVFVERLPSTKGDIWLMPLEGDRKPVPFLSTAANEMAPKFSPDGRWIAYASDETGRDEIYIRPIGSPGGRKVLSTGGGTWPAWNRNGRELFFIKGNKLASVALDPRMNRVGQEHVILDAPKFENLQFQADNPYYDVLPDGEHFVILLMPQYPAPTHYNIVVNWFEELKQRVPSH